MQVKLDDFSSLDAMQGKATRKLYAMVWEALVGSEAAALLPSGDVEDGLLRPAIGVSSQPVDAPPGPLSGADFSKPADGRQRAEGSRQKMEGRPRLSELDRDGLLQRGELLAVPRHVVRKHFGKELIKLTTEDLDELRRLLFRVENHAETWEQAWKRSNSRSVSDRFVSPHVKRMGRKSNIEWTDATWNPVVGCAKVSPGCAHCYAEKMAFRLRSMALADIAAGRDPGRKRHYIDAVDERGRWTGKLMPVPEARRSARVEKAADGFRQLDERPFP